jgi:hypothetical protein
MMRQTPNRKKRLRTLQPRLPIRKLPKRRQRKKSKRPRLMLMLKSAKPNKMLPRLLKIRLLMLRSKRR